MKTLERIGFIALAMTLLAACGQQEPTKTETSQDSTKEETPKSETKPSARPAHWGYTGDEGPANWGNLDPVYNMCAHGTHQSPIDIEKSDVVAGTDFTLNYGSHPAFHVAHNEHMDEIIDNGHTIQVSVEEGSETTINGKTYALKQFHFHTPSEHTVDGMHFPMEMHLVHQSDDESLAVVSVLFEEGETPNANFDKIIAHIPNQKGDSKHVTDTELNINTVVPSEQPAYHYSGSLTTPPCSEDVQWLVMKNTISLTPEQIGAFAAKIAENNRPVQPLNDRVVNADEIDFETE